MKTLSPELMVLVSFSFVVVVLLLPVFVVVVFSVKGLIEKGFVSNHD